MTTPVAGVSLVDELRFEACSAASPHPEMADMLHAAADEIERLGQALSDSSPKWIPVSELPDVFDQGGGEKGSAIVLAHWPNEWIGLAQYWNKGGWFWIEQDCGQEADADPTHWMPLPEPPK